MNNLSLDESCLLAGVCENVIKLASPESHITCFKDGSRSAFGGVSMVGWGGGFRLQN